MFYGAYGIFQILYVFWKDVKVSRSTDESANLYWFEFSINLEEARAHKMVRN
jgi:hypothetical protein